jgi:hypothetical protein
MRFTAILATLFLTAALPTNAQEKVLDPYVFIECPGEHIEEVAVSTAAPSDIEIIAWPETFIEVSWRYREPTKSSSVMVSCGEKAVIDLGGDAKIEVRIKIPEDMLVIFKN